MRLLKGSELTKEDQIYCLTAYVHRYTKEHFPQWANKPKGYEKHYPIQFESDQEWLEHTEFYVKKDGKLDSRTNHCFSHPTWPDNPELRS